MLGTPVPCIALVSLSEILPTRPIGNAARFFKTHWCLSGNREVNIDTSKGEIRVHSQGSLPPKSGFPRCVQNLANRSGGKPVVTGSSECWNNTSASPKLGGIFFGGDPHNKDSTICGSILRSPYLGKSSAKRTATILDWLTARPAVRRDRAARPSLLRPGKLNPRKQTSPMQLHYALAFRV